MTTCGVCNQSVDLANGPHIHDPKTCRSCKRSLPVTAFTPYKSSGDGRRMQCKECVATERPPSPSTEQREQRRTMQDAEVRAQRNQRLRESGYRWVIQAPDGRIMTIQQAEKELDAIDLEDNRSYWDEVPPGAYL